MTLIAVCLGASVVGLAQETPHANWKLASRFTSEYLRQYVYSTSLTPGWINKTDEFWYSWKDSSGVKFWRVDPKKKRKVSLFDSAKMAALLSETIKKPYDTTNLPITTITFDEKNDKIMRFVIDGIRYEYDADKETLKSLGKPAPGDAVTPPPAGGGGGGRGQGGFRNGGGANRDFRNYSPDKKAFVYAQDHNLFYVPVTDGKEGTPIQLTKDGEKDYSFGSRQQAIEDRQRFQEQTGQTGTQTPPPSSETRVRANVTWSKDSRRFYAMRFDDRKVKDLYLVNVLAEPRPTLQTYKYAMPGEPDVAQTELFIFNPDKKQLDRVPAEKYKDQRLTDVHFQDGSSDKLRFVRRDRLQRNLQFCEIDLKVNRVDVLLGESVENAYLETQPVRYVKPNGDFLWWSERSGWGHYYLYGNDGKLKNAITSGPWRNDDTVEVDAEKNMMWFVGVGKEADENPYYHHLYRVGLDGKGLTMLDGGNADHTTTLSPDHKFAVDVMSRTDLAPKAVVRDEAGHVIIELEQTDLTRLAETGWKMPETFKVKAADGVTDIYGNMWKPFDFDPKKKYPIIANVYPGPQTESVSSTFSATASNQRLAQLGFIVIQIGNRGGNPDRSNAYHSFGYYNLRDYGLADKKAGIEQLAARNPWIDIDKVGIFGHSGGGFMTAAALMLPPFNDFFKVGVSSSGNHDNNVYNSNWSEQHHGLREVPVTAATTATTTNGRTAPDEEPTLQTYAEGFPDDPLQKFDNGDSAKKDMKFEIKVPTNAELAPNLKGHLFLVHGDMDNNVHPAGTIRLMNALIKANKRFDFMLMPGKQHGYGDMQPYFTQRLMEYFVRYLLGESPPEGADMPNP